MSLLTCITKDNWAIPVTIIQANAKSKLCHNVFTEWYYPTSEIGHKLLCITSIFGSCHVFLTQYRVIQQSNMLVSYRFVYILFHGLSKITLVVPFLMLHINFGYLYPAMISFVDKILLMNRIHCKCLEHFFVSFRQEWLVLNIFSNYWMH